MSDKKNKKEFNLSDIQDISIADINDAPMFTHTKQFRDHFNYIKNEFIQLLKIKHYTED